MGYTTTIVTGRWEDIAAAGIWVYVTPDPLTGVGSVQVAVSLQPLRVQVAGPNGGVEIQSEPPHTDGGTP